MYASTRRARARILCQKSMTVLPHCFAMHYTHREHNSYMITLYNKNLYIPYSHYYYYYLSS